MSPVVCLSVSEACLRLGTQTDAASLATLLAHLQHPDWRVRYAAAVALGERPADAAAMVAPLVALLAAEAAAPLYTQPGDFAGMSAGCPHAVTLRLPADADEPTLAAWRRRGRVQQAALLTLGGCGLAARVALPVLHHYATAASVDALVRTAACEALGRLAQPDSRPTLTHAASDDEWCTRTTATKALRLLPAARTPETP